MCCHAVVYWPMEEIRAKFETTVMRKEAILKRSLERSLMLQRIWRRWGKAKANLQAGKVRMLFVVDEYRPNYGELSSSPNEQMDPAEVLAVEIKHYVGQGWNR